MNREVEDGLERARKHLGRAALESLLAARALMDATFLASGLDRSAPDSLAAEITRGLDGWIDALRDGRSVELPRALIGPLMGTLAAEIERWEKSSETDSTARPVLRALLGLREILWELGLRPTQASPSAQASERHAADSFDAADPADWPEQPDRGTSPFARAQARDEMRNPGSESATPSPAESPSTAPAPAKRTKRTERASPPPSNP